MAVRYESHCRVVGGRMVRVPTARLWTAEDYDVIEALIAQGLRYREMVPYFTDPPVSVTALQKARERAKIDYPHRSGRPKGSRNVR